MGRAVAFEAVVRLFTLCEAACVSMVEIVVAVLANICPVFCVGLVYLVAGTAIMCQALFHVYSDICGFIKIEIVPASCLIVASCINAVCLDGSVIAVLLGLVAVKTGERIVCFNRHYVMFYAVAGAAWDVLFRRVRAV